MKAVDYCNELEGETTMPDLKQMEAIALKRYRVNVHLKSIESFSIYAHNPQEAFDMVMKGTGRPIGKQGPQPIGAEVGEFDLTKAPVLDTDIRQERQDLVEAAEREGKSGLIVEA